jgi:hypothetical protein
MFAVLYLDFGFYVETWQTWLLASLSLKSKAKEGSQAGNYKKEMTVMRAKCYGRPWRSWPGPRNWEGSPGAVWCDPKG